MHAGIIGHFVLVGYRMLKGRPSIASVRFKCSCYWYRAPFAAQSCSFPGIRCADARECASEVRRRHDTLHHQACRHDEHQEADEAVEERATELRHGEEENGRSRAQQHASIQRDGVPYGGVVGGRRRGISSSPSSSSSSPTPPPPPPPPPDAT